MKILLTLDDCTISEAVTDMMITQIKTKDAVVRLLHVVEPFPENVAGKMGSREPPDFVAARLVQREHGKELLARAAERLRSAGFKVTSSVEEGDARNVILNQAERWHADLIVLGSHGRTGLDRFLMGSVSEAVARHARCSVEIVRIHPAR
jgi:nucleotide-binding universal stress UspA family protein